MAAASDGVLRCGGGASGRCGRWHNERRVYDTGREWLPVVWWHRSHWGGGGRPGRCWHDTVQPVAAWTAWVADDGADLGRQRRHESSVGSTIRWLVAGFLVVVVRI